MIGITSRWTYRDKLIKTRLGMSLQAYSQKKNDWVHMAYFTPEQINKATILYEANARWIVQDPRHLEFSFNNLIELKRIVDTCPDDELDGTWFETVAILEQLCIILNIRLEI